MYRFSMYGRIIEIHRFSVTYSIEDVERTEYCHSREQADSLAELFSGTVTALDTSAYEWLDGIEVADVPDTYAEAVRIYEMGREAYEAELQKPTPEEEITALKAQISENEELINTLLGVTGYAG